MRVDVSCRVQDQSMLSRVCLDHQSTIDDNYYSNRKLISLECQSQEKHEIVHLGLNVCREKFKLAIWGKFNCVISSMLVQDGTYSK